MRRYVVIGFALGALCTAAAGVGALYASKFVGEAQCSARWYRSGFPVEYTGGTCVVQIDEAGVRWVPAESVHVVVGVLGRQQIN